MRSFMVIAAVFLSAACQPGATGKFQARAAPEPGDEFKRTFAGCTWGEVKGADGLSIWSFACGPQFGNVRLNADNALPGFVLESLGPEGMVRRPVVRVFRKEVDASIEQILPAIRAASPGLQIETCGLEQAPAPDGASSTERPSFVLTPVGDARAAYEAALSSDTVPPAPCGPLGVSEVGSRQFFVLPSDPGAVVWVDYGSEIQIFDVGTLKRDRQH